MAKKILVIEDNEDDLLIIKRYLNNAGYNELVTADNAKDALEKTASEKPDLVITDTLLPGADGFEVCRQIRELYKEKAPRIIIMTGSIDAVDAVKARKVGADDYCAKTADCANLIEAVQKLI